MRISRYVIVFDAPDLAAESAFWARMLGGTVEPDDDLHAVCVDGEARLGIQLAPDHGAPDWPGTGPPEQIPLARHVDGVRAAHEETMSLGAKFLQPAEDVDA